MKKLVIIALPLLILGLFGVYKLGFIEAWQPDPLSVQGLFEATNKERAKAGVRPLKLDERLNESASKKVAEIVSEGWKDNSHINNAGVHGYTYALEAVEGCQYASENLAAYAVGSARGISGLMTSKSHRDAILDERFELVGIAYKNGYVVQHFCDIM